MIFFKEEINNSSSLEERNCQNTHLTAHQIISSEVAMSKLSGKSRISLGFNNHINNLHKEQSSGLKNHKKQTLPILGTNYCINSQTNRMNQSLIVDNSVKLNKSKIIKIKLSQLNNSLCKLQNNTQNQTSYVLNIVHEKVAQTSQKQNNKSIIKRKMRQSSGNIQAFSKKQKKIGYEGQKNRIKQDHKMLIKFLRNYEKVNICQKLSQSVKNLRQQTIKTNLNNSFLLLPKQTK